MKKFMSLLMAIVMVFCLATPVKAEQTFEITHPGSNDHTYEIYQIFTGDLDTTGTVLSNVKWGKNGTGETGSSVDANILKALKDLADEDLSDQVQLAEIEKYVTLTNPFKTLTKTEGTVSVAAGYYLIKDVNGSLTNKDDAYTEYIVQIVGDVTISPKSVKPRVDKQVQDENGDKDINSTLADGWGETADHEINETFQFKLIATIPANKNLAGYKNYKVVFTDTMADGITFEKIVSVFVAGQKVTDYDCKAKAGQAGGSWTLTIDDIKPYVDDLTKGAIIEVIYDAHLNEDAAVGNNDANKNTVSLQYSNNPNASGNGEGETNELGKTPEDHVWVFTYKADVTKVDGQDTSKLLDNAEFKLRNEAGEWAVIDENGIVQKDWAAEEKDGSVLKTVNGKFVVIGLDAGTYYLKETKAPDGYNLLTEEVEVVISAKHNEKDAEQHAETYYLKTTENGTEKANPNVEVTVKNNTGTTLPETGGMGTTLFYVFGSLLAVGAIVLLVTKKRMDEE